MGAEASPNGDTETWLDAPDLLLSGVSLLSGWSVCMSRSPDGGLLTVLCSLGLFFIYAVADSLVVVG